MSAGKFKVGDKVIIIKTHRASMIGKIVAPASNANYQWLVEIKDGDFGYCEDELSLYLEDKMKDLLIEFAQIRDKNMMINLQQEVQNFLKENFIDWEND